MGFVRGQTILAGVLCGLAGVANGQDRGAGQPLGTAFTYQGRLTDGGAPASGPYDLELKLFDASVGGNQIAPTVVREDVPVAGGLFTVPVDFGPGAFNGQARWLEIGVRPGASQGSFVMLDRRQELTPTPHALHGATAPWEGVTDKPPGFADDQDNDALGVLPCANGQIAKRTAGAWACAADADSGGDITAVTAGAGLTGGAATGAATVAVAFGGSGTATTVARTDHLHSEYVLGTDARLLNVSGLNNVFGGVGAGQNNTGFNNTFYGRSAGGANTGGDANSFVGALAGQTNTTGIRNSFFGALTGQLNTTGEHNAFFGASAGSVNNASDNSFFGSGAGDSNTSGTFNAFFGRSAGGGNTTQIGNSFFGYQAGLVNQGSNNAFFGRHAGVDNTAGFNGAFFGSLAGQNNTTGEYNAFFGALAGSANTIADKNAYFGANAGLNSTAGANTFVGGDAGMQNTLGFGNVFVGHQAALANTTGSNNTIVGANANTFGGTLSFATATGAGALATNSNTVVLGRPADTVRVPGAMNVVGALDVGTLDVGADVLVGGILATGATVVVGGRLAVQNNSGLSPALDVEGNAKIDGALDVIGDIQFNASGTGTTGTMCYNLPFNYVFGPCASSRRYKTDVDELAAGLDVVERLRPVTFTWRKTGARDLGLIAEEVAEVDPLLATYDREGRTEGVKYQQLTAILINAIKEQQAQIARLREELDALKALASHLNR